jgi:inward rectifier potassium channel
MTRHARRRPKSPAARLPKKRRGSKMTMSRTEVHVHGLPRRLWQDLYHLCMTVSWPRLFVAFAACFVIFNLMFAVLYHAVPGSIANLNPPGYAGAFFFSVETLATVGYGDMHPQSTYGHIVASIQIFIGTVYLALLAGIVFSRFSRPAARFIFSDLAVIRPLDGKTTLMFRSANGRHNNFIVEASARLRMTYDAVSVEGYKMRRIADLRLLREEHPLFALGWTLMHVIDEHSPLANQTPESLAAMDVTFILTLRGTDETTGQVFLGRSEYLVDALRWNCTFLDVLETDADGILQYDYEKFHEVVPLQEIAAPRAIVPEREVVPLN